VKHLFCLSLVTCLVVTLAGCGNVFVSGAVTGGSSSVIGAVSIVQFSAIIGENGTTIQVTFVTFLENGTSSTVGFCGDQRSRFPMQQTVRTEFNPGRSCANILDVSLV
jgi:hypothetical protein